MQGLLHQQLLSSAMVQAASLGRGQLKNSFAISMGSGRPSIKFTVEQEEDETLLSSTHYSERITAWMSLSTGSPRTQTGISTLSPIIGPMYVKRGVVRCIYNRARGIISMQGNLYYMAQYHVVKERTARISFNH